MSAFFFCIPEPTPEPEPMPEPMPGPEPIPVPEPTPGPQAARRRTPKPRGSAVEAFRTLVEPLDPEPIELLESVAEPAQPAAVADPAAVEPKKEGPRVPKLPRPSRQPKAGREPRRPRERAPKRVAPTQPNAAQTLLATARARAAERAAAERAAADTEARAAGKPAGIPVEKTPVRDAFPEVAIDETTVEDVEVQELPDEAQAEVEVEAEAHGTATEPDRSSYAPLPSTAPQMPAVYRFPPRKSGRRLLNLLLLAGLAATAWFGYDAWLTRDEVAIGVASIVGFTTLVVWGVRAGAAPTTLTVRRGQLEVKRQGSRFVFDLASTYTPIEVVGEPGRRRWKVLFLRRGMPPYKVDSSMVDPHEFMRVLRFFRPERPR